MSFESAYKVEDVAAIRVAPEEIDGTFRSSSIGELSLHSYAMDSRERSIPESHAALSHLGAAMFRSLSCARN
jgi:hypothetical protein